MHALMPPTRPPTWWYVVVPLLSALLTVALIEAGLAIFHPIPFSIESNMYFEPDPFTGYRLKPNATGYFQRQIPARTNAHGHRGRPVAEEKPEGTFRILVLGDSFTAGANVAEESAYPQVLERRLNEVAARPVEVVNTGVGGWEPFQYAEYYDDGLGFAAWVPL